jgi:transposase-like protein
MSNEPTVKRWTAKRKAAVVMDIFKGKTTVAEVARQHDLTVSEVEGWIEEAQRSMENGFRARPKDIREQYESELRETKEALGEAHLQIYVLKKWRRLLDEDENS